MTAKAHYVRHGYVDRRAARLVWNVVQVAFRVGMVQVDGGRNDARLNSHDGDDGFNRARRAQCMPGHGLGGTDRQAISVVTEAGFNSDGLRFIIKWS